jgi:hypothetical protein
MIYILLTIPLLIVLIGLLKIWTFSSHERILTKGQENANLVRVLLDLEPGPREQLFRLYQEQFGAGAARYARRTYQKWKDGTVQPNKQTFRRFLINLPHVMTFDLKCEVLRELREAYCEQDNYQVTVTTDDWQKTLAPLIESVLKESLTVELPDFLQRRLTWLAEDDVTVANALLAESEARQTRNSLVQLEKEFTNIEHLLKNVRGRGRVIHELRLPLCTIVVRIEKGNGNG